MECYTLFIDCCFEQFHQHTFEAISNSCMLRSSCGHARIYSETLEIAKQLRNNKQLRR